MEVHKITIVYREKENIESCGLLGRNLEDMAYALNKDLKLKHNASSSAVFAHGRVELNIVGADYETLEPYMSSFQEAMTKSGFLLIVIFN